MNIELVSKNGDFPEALREFTEKKLHKLEKFLDEEIRIHLVLEPEGRERSVEIQVEHRHGSFHAHEVGADERATIQSAIDKIEKQARRDRKKFQKTRVRAERQVAREADATALE